ncbi:hypothetical protein [Streptomyces cyaneofuscatus]|uniref:hypothetical protein n=1 Tax=Streptomyces cyaneofuscatus TaxID=66883 RepID=UPI00365026D9
MKENDWLLVSLVLFLVALPVLSLGTYHDVPPLWIFGLVLVVVAGLVPVILRFAPSPGDNGKDE